MFSEVRRRGRVVEGTPLLREHAYKTRIKSSNLFVSARVYSSKYLFLYSALVAQMDRVLGYEPRGQEFESLRAHQFNKKANFKKLAFLLGRK